MFNQQPGLSEKHHVDKFGTDKIQKLNYSMIAHRFAIRSFVQTEETATVPT